MRVSFDPKLDGFAFDNSFTNKVQIAGIPITETLGRCGGMAFAALDYWHHMVRIPVEPALPGDGIPLAEYIYDRLITSIVNNWPMFFHFMRTPDHPTWLNGIGVARATREEQYPKLKTLLEQGLPQPIGLVQSRDVGGFARDHQVVAYGYEEDGDSSRVFIWDNRYPGAEGVLEFTSVYDPGNRFVHQDNGQEWRGFFVENYSPQLPWYLANGKLLSDQGDARIYVIYAGAKFWITSPDEFDRLGLRWSEVLELKDGSLNYISTIPGDRAVLREIDDAPVSVTYGGKGFHIPDPDTLFRLGFTWNDVRVVPAGGFSALDKAPRDLALLKEETAAAVYVVEHGELRHVPDPETFAARGFRWDRIGVVPDGGLADIPVGPPLPPSHPTAWSERPGGHLVTRDLDRVDYQVEAGARPDDEVEFVIRLGDGITWRKEIVLQADDGEWTIAAHDDVRSDANGLYRYQLANGGLRLRKAKAFGVMTDVLELGDLARLPVGARVTFTWVRD
ncbi:hypothetical protein [Amycolatopsis solani]|uniref:hypothetical protein n=1 Tax=Amycolatopsis solani TaxID=3028615 RepID=UPI0025AFC303|nr:hypothetical protein [Amycolatopsis sp. MEP2-6]